MSVEDTRASLEKRLRARMEPFLAEGLPIIMGNEATPPADIGGRPAVRIRVDAYDLCSATIQRTPHVSEGMSLQSCHVDLYRLDRKEVEAVIDGHLDEIAALLRQDVVILAAGGDPRRAGAAHHKAPGALARAAVAWQLDAEEIVRPKPLAGWTHDGVTRSEVGLFTDAITHEHEQIRIEVSRHLVRRYVHLDLLSFTVRKTGALIATLHEKDGDLLLHLPGTAVPDTVLAGLAGRKIGDVARFAEMETLLDERIANAWNIGPPDAGLLLKLEADMMTLG